MRTFALAILAFAVSANSCGVYESDCKESAPLCTPEKVCNNVCTDITTFITKWEMKKIVLKNVSKGLGKFPAPSKRSNVRMFVWPCTNQWLNTGKRSIQHLWCFSNIFLLSDYLRDEQKCEEHCVTKTRQVPFLRPEQKCENVSVVVH